MVIKLDVPTIKYDAQTVTLSSKMSGTTIYYRFNPDTSWIVYTNPLTNITGGTIETYCKKEGYTSSEIATQTLEGFGIVTVVGDGIILSMADGDFEHLEINTDFSTLHNPHIAYGNGLYVVVGNYGEVITSPDAVNWNDYNQNLGDGYWNDITYCNGCFVAVSSAGIIARTTDGVDWEIIHEGKGCLSKIINIHEGNAMLILSDKKTYETTDGTDLVETSTYPFQNYNLTDMITYGAYSDDSNTAFVSFLGGDTGGGNPKAVQQKMAEIYKNEANSFTFTVILFGVGNGADYKKAAADMGIRPELVAEVGRTGAEIRKMIGFISSSVSSSAAGGSVNNITF